MLEDSKVVGGLSIMDNFAEGFTVLNSRRRERMNMVKGLSAVGVPPKIAGFERLEWFGSREGL